MLHYSTQQHTMLLYTTPYHTKPCCTTQHNNIPCYFTLHHITLSHATLLNTTIYHVTLYHATTQHTISFHNTPCHTTLHHTTHHNTPCNFTLHHEKTLHYPTLPHTTSHHGHHIIDMAALLITILRISRGHSQRTNPGQRYYISTWSMHDWIVRKREDPSMSPRVSSCPCIRLHSHVNPLSPETRNINP